jgi:naphthoate synthase
MAHPTDPVSAAFNPKLWRPVPGFAANRDITYHRGVAPNGADTVDMPWARIAFNRPEVRNAFRPETVDQLIAALQHAAESPELVAVLLAGNNPSPKDGGYAFCSGGDQRRRGKDGYQYDCTNSTPHPPNPPGQSDQQDCPTATDGDFPAATASNQPAAYGGGRLHILQAQTLIRSMPKVVIAVVDGWAAGGGHSLQVIADLTLACRQHARFKQTDATVGSFDAGYGSALLARQVGQKRARQIFFLAQTYSAEQAEAWGAINLAVDHSEIESTAIAWARIISEQSPQAIRALKYAFNLPDDGLAGQQLFAAETTRLAYGTVEGQEGRDAFLEHRPPDWTPFRKLIL